VQCDKSTSTDQTAQQC